MHYVYLIAPKNGSAPTKVGLSSNPQRRLREIQTSNPTTLTLWATFGFPNRLVAQDAEQFVRLCYSDKSLGREWLDVRPAEVIELAADHVAEIWHGPSA